MEFEIKIYCNYFKICLTLVFVSGKYLLVSSYSNFIFCQNLLHRFAPGFVSIWFKMATICAEFFY